MGVKGEVGRPRKQRCYNMNKDRWHRPYLLEFLAVLKTTHQVILLRFSVEAERGDILEAHYFKGVQLTSAESLTAYLMVECCIVLADLDNMARGPRSHRARSLGATPTQSQKRKGTFHLFGRCLRSASLLTCSIGSRCFIWYAPVWTLATRHHMHNQKYRAGIQSCTALGMIRKQLKTIAEMLERVESNE